MSLILEALRKLERDKPAPERGVVVMTSSALGDDRAHRSPWLWLGLGLAAGIAGAVAILESRKPDAPTTPSHVAATLPTSPPSAGAARPAPPQPTPTPPQTERAAVATPPPVSAAARATEAAPPAPPATTVPAATPTGALVLQAITIQNGVPVALISDRILREGDEIDGVRIVRIGEAEVEVERDGRRDVLRF